MSPTEPPVKPHRDQGLFQINRQPKPLPDQSKPHPDQGLFQMNREPQPPLPDVERLIRESKEHTHNLNWWRRVHALFLALSILVTIWSLTRQASDWLFGRTVTYRFGGVHAPLYTRTEFEQEFTKRFAESGFAVGQLRIIRQSHLNQFDGEITLIRVPSNVDDYDVLNRLRKIGDSMEDRALPVEPAVRP